MTGLNAGQKIRLTMNMKSFIAVLILAALNVFGQASNEQPNGEETTMTAQELSSAAEAISKNTRVPALERKQLQKLANDNPSIFSFQVHNRLRHLHSVLKDPVESSRQTEIILRNIFLDPYTMNILSGWNLEKDPKAAIASYEKSLKDTKKDFPVTQAACLIMLGDLHLAQDKPEKAKSFYEEVVKLQGEGIEEYHATAKSRLEQL